MIPVTKPAETHRVGAGNWGTRVRSWLSDPPQLSQQEARPRWRRSEVSLNKTLWPSGWRTMLLSAPWGNKVYFNWNSAHLHASPVILHKECTIVNFQFPFNQEKWEFGFLVRIKWDAAGNLSSIACYTVGNHFMIGVFIITACGGTFNLPRRLQSSLTE